MSSPVSDLSERLDADDTLESEIGLVAAAMRQPSD